MCPSRFLRTLIAHDCLSPHSPSRHACLAHLRQLHPQLHLPTLAADVVQPQTPERSESVGNGICRLDQWHAPRMDYAKARKSVLDTHKHWLPVEVRLRLLSPKCGLGVIW